MLSQCQFGVDLGVKRQHRLIQYFQQYYVGQIGQGLEVHTEIYAL